MLPEAKVLFIYVNKAYEKIMEDSYLIVIVLCSIIPLMIAVISFKKKKDDKNNK